MNKLANMALDIVDELLQGDVDSLLNLIQDLPESVKTAHIPTSDDLDEIAEDNFALVLFDAEHGFLKKFANYNPELTQLNGKLFCNKEKELPEELCKIAGANLFRAYKQFSLEIPEELNKYASEQYVDNVVDLGAINRKEYIKKLENVEKEYKEVKLAYALQDQQKFPIHDEFHQKKAVEYFDNYSATLDIPARIEYAKNVKLACDFSSDKIYKYANFDIESYSDDTELNIKARKRHISKEKHKYLDGLLNKLATLTPLQTCMYLEEIDNSFNLNKLYGKHFEDAPSSCFGIKKEASIVSKTGKEVFMSDINKIVEHEKFAELVSEDMAKALKSDKALEMFDLLPESFQTKLLNL